MRFSLTFFTPAQGAVLPLNYQYPLSAVIYRILQQADSTYANFLHNTGYKQAGSLKSFKLFTFSDIKTPFRIVGDRLQLSTQRAELVVCFHLPQAAETFIRGLFMQQEVEIADRKSRARFTITQVEAIPSPLTNEPVQEIVIRPISPTVCGVKNERSHYDFLSPEQPEFEHQLLYNWKEKYKTVYGEEQTEADFSSAAMEVIFYSNPPKSRLITIKADTAAETKIKGWNNFRLRVSGKKEALELLLNSGMGLYNAQGMGCAGM